MYAACGGAQVYIAPIDKEHLLRELEAVTGLDEPSEDFATVMPSIAKARRPLYASELLFWHTLKTAAAPDWSSLSRSP
jgi:hypothetical protein